jgi:hypothetical protein
MEITGTDFGKASSQGRITQLQAAGGSSRPDA